MRDKNFGVFSRLIFGGMLSVVAVSARAQVPLPDALNNTLSTIQAAAERHQNALVGNLPPAKEVTLTPEAVISFDGSPFHLFAHEPCPAQYMSYKNRCLKLNTSPRLVRVALVPARNQRNPVFGVVRVGGDANGMWSIQLLSIETGGSSHQLASEPFGTLTQK